MTGSPSVICLGVIPRMRSRADTSVLTDPTEKRSTVVQILYPGRRACGAAQLRKNAEGVRDVTGNGVVSKVPAHQAQGLQPLGLMGGALHRGGGQADLAAQRGGLVLALP